MILPKRESVAAELAQKMLEAGCNRSEATKLLHASLAIRALEKTSGNISRAARLLGIHRNSFTRELTLLNLDRLPRQIRKKNVAQLKLWTTAGRKPVAGLRETDVRKAVQIA